MAPAPLPSLLRCVTLNLWGGNGPVERRMPLVIEGLRALAPDLVALQEVRDIPGTLPNQAEKIAAAIGMTHVFASAVEWGGGHEGLGIISRHAMAQYEVTELPHGTATERRIMLSARLRAGAGEIWAHTTHLNYRLHHGKEREDQVLALEPVVAARSGELPQILLGDFNATPDSDEIRWLRGLTTLGGRRVFYQDAWALTHLDTGAAAGGITWAKSNPFTAPLRWLNPDRRIDYIFVSPQRRDGRGKVAGCAVVLDAPDTEGVYPSDHFGLMADIQITPDAA